MPNLDVKSTTTWFATQTQDAERVKNSSLALKVRRTSTRITLQGMASAQQQPETDPRSTMSQQILSGLEERMRFPSTSYQTPNANYWVQ